MKIFRMCLALLASFALWACVTDPKPDSFTAEQLRDMTPIMQFRDNPVPEKCFSDSAVTVRDGRNPYFRIYCYYYYEQYADLYDAIEKMGWEYDSDEGSQGDCGPKHEYTKTVNHRRLHLYVKTCSEDMFVKSDRFLFHVEYD